MTPARIHSHLRNLTFATCVMVCLLGCANQASPGYFLEWVPPGDAAGQECVASCRSEKWQCGTRALDKADLCAAEQDAAFAECQYEADMAFESCLVKLQTLYPYDWESLAATCDTGPAHCPMPTCSAHIDCEAQFEGCFLDCGGDVIERGNALDTLTESLENGS